jgi:hypothetical protein
MSNMPDINKTQVSSRISNELVVVINNYARLTGETRSEVVARVLTERFEDDLKLLTSTDRATVRAMAKANLERRKHSHIGGKR